MKASEFVVSFSIGALVMYLVLVLIKKTTGKSPLISLSERQCNQCNQVNKQINQINIHKVMR